MGGGEFVNLKRFKAKDSRERGRTQWRDGRVANQKKVTNEQEATVWVGTFGKARGSDTV